MQVSGLVAMIILAVKLICFFFLSRKIKSKRVSLKVISKRKVNGKTRSKKLSFGKYANQAAAPHHSQSHSPVNAESVLADALVSLGQLTDHSNEQSKIK